MSRSLPPLDLHAHIATDIHPRELEGLGAVVFAVTRSLDEHDVIRERSDALTVWGVGCHPGLVTAQKRFDADRFAAAIRHAAFVGEVGLDGSSKVPMELQEEVLASVLDTVASTPRLTSIHSYRATKRVLDLIEQTGAQGVVLHWWLGSEAETKRALALGCLFSINQSMDLGKLQAAGVPITSLLPETDHPSGNRHAQAPRQPGQTLDVERSVATSYGVSAAVVRAQFWSTLAELLIRNEIEELLPPVVQAMIRHARSA
jgi:TatD DNase family protein